MSYGSTTSATPLGLKLICGFNGFMTIVGFFGFLLMVLGATASSSGLGATEGPVILVGIAIASTFTFGHLILLYFLLKMNRIAYILYLFFGGIAVAINILSFNIIAIVINGTIFAYLLSINRHF